MFFKLFIFIYAEIYELYFNYLYPNHQKYSLYLSKLKETTYEENIFYLSTYHNLSKL